MRKLTTLLAAALIVMPVSLLTACASDAAGSSAPAGTESSTAGEATAQVELSDGWAKAGEIGGMTGVFGTLSNDGDSDLVITGVESADAGMIELHEITADGIMQEITGEVVIPAKGTFELAPGANHIMLMDLKKDLLAGDEVTFTLQLASNDGRTRTVEFTVLVKDYAGANENYGGTGHEGMAHGDESHDSH